MRVTILFCLLSFMTVCTEAQEKWVYEATPLSLAPIAECEQNQYLSEDVRMFLSKFNQVYSKKVNMGAPDFQTSIEIIKPDLYYSVQKLSKYFCKCMKKGTLEKNVAEDEFRNILKKCLQIVQRDTSPIEAELRATNNPADIVGVFDRIVIEN